MLVNPGSPGASPAIAPPLIRRTACDTDPQPGAGTATEKPPLIVDPFAGVKVNWLFAAPEDGRASAVPAAMSTAELPSATFRRLVPVRKASTDMSALSLCQPATATHAEESPRVIHIVRSPQDLFMSRR